MIEEFELDNGLRVVCERMPHLHSVSIGAWIAAGSGYEIRKNNGVSHFIEHLLFKGTKTRSAAKIAAAAENVGGQLNAFTARDCTCFYVKLLDSHIDIGLDILSDILLNSLFNENSIEMERNVVFDEIAMYQDTPEEFVQDIANELVWKGSPMGYPILGNVKSLSSFDRNTILEYTDKYYNPVNSVLAISGNFGENIIKKVEKYFGKWENKNITYIRRQSAKYSKAVKKIPKDCEQNHICITFDALNNNDPLAYSTIALNNILGGTMSSRLFQKIREDMGLVYSIYSYVSLYNSEGLLSIYAGMNASNEEKVISAIFKEIKKLMKSSITARELTIAKEQLKSSILFSSDSTESIMNSIGKTMLIRGKIITVEEIYKKIEEISMDKIYEVINKVFNVEDAGIISLGM